MKQKLLLFVAAFIIVGQYFAPIVALATTVKPDNTKKIQHNTKNMSDKEAANAFKINQLRTTQVGIFHLGEKGTDTDTDKYGGYMDMLNAKYIGGEVSTPYDFALGLLYWNDESGIYTQLGMDSPEVTFQKFVTKIQTEIPKKQILSAKKGSKVTFDITDIFNSISSTNANTMETKGPWAGQNGVVVDKNIYNKGFITVAPTFADIDLSTYEPKLDDEGNVIEKQYLYDNTSGGVTATLAKINDKVQLSFERTNEEPNQSATFKLNDLNIFGTILSSNPAIHTVQTGNAFLVPSNIDANIKLYGSLYAPLQIPKDYTADLSTILDVSDSKADMEVKDIDVEQGSTWNAAEQIVSLTDIDGNDVSDKSVVKTEGSVDTDTVGDYVVKFIYDATEDSQIVKEATVHVTEQKSKASLKVRNIGIEFPVQTNRSIEYTDEDKLHQIVSVTDDDGNNVDSSGVTVEGTDKITGRPKIGTTYDLIFKYTTASGKQVTATGTATVTDAFVLAKNVYKKAGETYVPTESFLAGMNDSLDGNQENLQKDDERLTYSSKEHIIAENEKSSDVTITYTSKNNSDVDIISSTKKLVISKAEIDTQDSTIYVGDEWDPSDNIKSAVDVDGNSIEYDKSWLDTSDVDVTKPGTYTVNYKMKDSDGIVITSASAKVTVEKAVVPYFGTVPTKIDFGDDIDLGLADYITHAVSDYDAPFTVVDEQEYKGGWEVQATVLKDLQTDDKSSVLTDSLMYAGKQLSGQSTTIASVAKAENPSAGTDKTILSTTWTNGNGLNLKAKRQSIIADTKYSGSVEWTLVIAP